MNKEPLKNKITPEQLHKWYLEACKHLNPSNYNKDAQKPYFELTDEQRIIDVQIADKINKKVKSAVEWLKEQVRERFTLAGMLENKSDKMTELTIKFINEMIDEAFEDIK